VEPEPVPPKLTVEEQERLCAEHADWARSVGGNMARKRPRYDADDLVHEAILGLWKAVLRYDPARGTPFRGFARPWVENQVRMFCRRGAALNAQMNSMEGVSYAEPGDSMAPMISDAFFRPVAPEPKPPSLGALVAKIVEHSTR